MKKFVISIFSILLPTLTFATPAFAQTDLSDITSYTNDTLELLTVIGVSAVVIFVIKGGYAYMTSTGKPESLDSAKKTLRNAFLGLILILSANVFVSILSHSINPVNNSGGQEQIEISQIETVEPSEGLTQVLIDAVAGFIQNIVESSTAPIVNGVIEFLTTTPTLLDNSVVRQFWLVSLGIVNVLFVLVVALVGLQLMSASTFGFEEIEIKQILPRLGLGFLLANISLFLANYAIITCNALVTTILNNTGGLNRAWVVDAINPTALITGSTPLITLIFLVIFLVVSIGLFLMYVMRLIIVALLAVLSPFAFLMWSLPKYSDFATILMKTYLVSVFVVFVHVVMVQLASAFIALPDHSENSLVSIATGIGLFFVLLKTPHTMMQMVMYSSGTNSIKKLGNQIINVVSTDNSSSVTREAAKNAGAKVSSKIIKV